MNPLPTLALRAFDADDQRAFAKISGDSNPMHMDPVAARRTQAGAPVVHGVHSVVWALDTLFERNPSLAINSLKVRFDKFMFVGDIVSVVIARRVETSLELALMVADVRVAFITLTLGQRRLAGPWVPSAPRPPLVTPLELTLSELEASAGAFAFASGDSAITEAFPNISRALGPETVQGLLALSTLVGMHAPGLHSIFSKIALDFTEPAGSPRQLDFKVAKIQPLFRLLTLSVAGPGVEGTVEAFLRQPPVAQPPNAELRRHVKPGEFMGARVLVAGGSRGLGEAAAKLLALGGAEVIITYASGAADAEAVAADLRADGAACQTLRLDINEPLSGQPLRDLAPITHLYYFATPPIFKQKAGLYVEAVFQQFAHAYVTAFYALCQAVLETNGGAPLKVFYPSSTVVAEPIKDAVEYGMAKAAGEMLCAEMVRRTTGLDILIERLPRLPTDQTATILPAKSASTLEILVPVIRRMQALTDTKSV